MPTHNDRLLQRILDTLDAEDSKFKIIRFVAEPGGPSPFTLDPPMLIGGSPEQRLAALESWYAELIALPVAERGVLNVARVTEALNELARLRVAVQGEPR